MLISWSRRFLFLANLKTASTTIEGAFGDLTEIKVSRSELGKHIIYRNLIQRFNWVFSVFPYESFFSFGVIRDPVDYIISLYNSHADPKFDNSKLSTKDMPFSDFWQDWCRVNSDQARPQTETFVDAEGRLRLKYLISFDKLEAGVAEVCRIAKLPQRTIAHENQSPKIMSREDLDPALEAEIRDRYKIDFFVYKQMSDRLLSGQEKIEPKE